LYGVDGLQFRWLLLQSTDVHDTVIVFVEPAEVYGPEIDGPDGDGDGLEGHALVGEQTTDVNEVLLPADAPDLTDSRDVPRGGPNGR